MLKTAEINTADKPALRLLPRYDSYMLGYKSRDFMVAGDYARAVHPGGGLIRSTLIVDGLAQGTWLSKSRRSGLTVALDVFETLDQDLTALIDAEVKDMERFLGVNTDWRFA